MPDGDPDADGVLAGRLAATLVTHDPGWRLPRPSEIARRHNASLEDVHAAVEELVSRGLIRRAPDGYLYLTGPADYRVSLEGMAGLYAYADPMGGDLTCMSFGMSRQAASTDTAGALRVTPGKQVGVLKLTWALNGTPAAMSTTYLASDATEPDMLARWLAEHAERDGRDGHDRRDGRDDPPILSPGPLPPPGPATPATAGGQRRNPHAVSVRMQLPSASAARRLRLRPGQMALVISMLFCDGPGHQPAALTVTVLRPDMFQITLESQPAGLDGKGLQATLSLAAADLPGAPGDGRRATGDGRRGRRATRAPGRPGASVRWHERA